MTIDKKVNSLKIILAGDSGAGKSSLLSRLVGNNFDIKCTSTDGFINKTYHLKMGDETIETDIWDFGGREKYRAVTNCSFQDADGILLVYDISNADSFQSVTDWLKDIVQFAHPKTCIQLVGNKNDLERTVSTKDAETFADKHGLSFTETSALNDNNINIPLKELCTTIKSLLINPNNSVLLTCALISKCMKNNNREKATETSKDGQPEPFDIVLVDIKAASQCSIECVKKSLYDEKLKYVALSYRWGELEEKLVDTKVGYIAKLTSFRTYDFITLCQLMKKEVDLKDINYVWVDAICVNQIDHDQRKATIYKMSTIYEKASFIIAVPDLHSGHLLNISSMNRNLMKENGLYGLYLYYFIHGNRDQLARIEEKWLDQINVPNDPELRRLLQTCTSHLTDELMSYRLYHKGYNSSISLNHIYETAVASNKTVNNIDTNNDIDTQQFFTDRLHQNCVRMECPLDFCHRDGRKLPEWRKDMMPKLPNSGIPWNHLIQERGRIILQSIAFMKDLIVDWSNRVWVISEFTIAKEKNNLKYWFLQLIVEDKIEDIKFFKFDVHDTSITSTIKNEVSVLKVCEQNYTFHHPPYYIFHQTIITRLNERPFLEMMLDSKASKHEDRFYAILPLTEYKTKITHKTQVYTGNIDTLLSVELILYEIMNTKDKLTLLFLHGNKSVVQSSIVLPTFGTSTIHWIYILKFFTLKGVNTSDYNFDLTSHSTITLHQSLTISDLYYLHLKPKEYYAKKYTDVPSFESDIFRPGRKPLESYEPDVLVCIPSVKQAAMKASDMSKSNSNIYWDHHAILLVGSFENNIWTLGCFHFLENAGYIDDNFSPGFDGWDRFAISEDNSFGFNIY